ncbi:MAG: hypothetical protein M3P06_21860 [Acidobacteriota bacterium]|nr:hypothetical protein [Acidobacteriota bacterium]
MTEKAKTWVVTTSGDRPLKDVAKDLRKSGFKVDEVLDEIGCITGKGGEDVVKNARKVKGVADVSANAPIDIGPPNSSDTW